jgi:hypothetical protein
MNSYHDILSGRLKKIMGALRYPYDILAPKLDIRYRNARNSQIKSIAMQSNQDVLRALSQRSSVMHRLLFKSYVVSLNGEHELR